MDVALHLSKLLVDKGVAKHVIEIVSRSATTAEFNSRSNRTERWDLTWPGETHEARKAAVQLATAALIDHGYRVDPRP
jgi:hypothetical protein